MISIIIPAHNEANVIVQCLNAMLPESPSDGPEILVVCNGCSDNTANLARQVSDKIKVIETDVASKSHALNLGDQAATGYPRFYVDADVILPWDAIVEVSDELARGDIFAAAPLMDVDLRRRSWFIKSFYKVWLQLPYCRTGMIGSGVYALNDAGRRRFDQFPEITSDDGYVRLLFSTRERKTVESCTFTIRPPKTIAGLIAIKTRAHFGNLELQVKYPKMQEKEQSDHVSALKQMIGHPTSWPALGVYMSVRVISRLKANWRFRFGDHRKWDRDDTGRELVD